MPGKDDLSGQWDGHFDYPAGAGPSTAFLANIQHKGGRITGTIIEPDLYSGAAPAEARIVGVAAGQNIDFTKTYTRASRGYENPVDYVGQLSGDGNRITGMWSIYEMNGTFEMTRQIDIEESVERKETVEIEQ
ncbi:hypothetical protein [Aurantiacibacter sediminis]|uniref:DUF1579 domain-containing protein n=1 Tax=Aurantiacibacter sediminis TaxID=2793064 RepID=A0ABS0N620_9SPHN|nr:hypothetical protein [Aurantiacibacter sediminis]MBH5323222.1 hypothetical protein [Aurantiacibacter sediminis]